MISFFHFPLCPHSRAIRLALGEGGVQPAFVEMLPWAPTREFLNINPAGTLPVFSAEGKFICGVYPIVEYLAEAGGRDGAMGARPPLWPAGAYDRAEARRVADWFVRKFDVEVSQYLMEEKLYKPMARRRSPPDLAVIKAGRANLRYHLAYISFLSDQRKWLGGDTISFADLAAAAALSALDYLSEIPWSDFPEAKSWYARVKSRPSFRPLLADAVPGFAPPTYYADLDF
jgi:glutathione S-transferase